MLCFIECCVWHCTCNTLFYHMIISTDIICQYQAVCKFHYLQAPVIFNDLWSSVYMLLLGNDRPKPASCSFAGAWAIYRILQLHQVDLCPLSRKPFISSWLAVVSGWTHKKAKPICGRGFPGNIHLYIHCPSGGHGIKWSFGAKLNVIMP